MESFIEFILLYHSLSVFVKLFLLAAVAEDYKQLVMFSEESFSDFFNNLECNGSKENDIGEKNDKE